MISKMQSDTLAIIESDYENPEHCLQIILLTKEYLCDPMGDNLSILDNSFEQRLINGLQMHPSSIVYFLKSSDTFIGMAVCFRGFSTFKAKQLLNIHDLIIYKDYRGKGYGKLFLAKISEIALKKDFCKLTLEVRNDNFHAKRLYKFSGFKPCNNPMEFWTKEL